MRSLKTFAALAVAVCAFSALGVASASAAQFTASATGELVGRALNTQEFTTNGGVIKCTKAHTTGKINATASLEQHVTVEYSECTGPLGVKAEVSPATYLFTSNGTVHIKNTITVKMPGLGCSVTVGEQTVEEVTFDNVKNAKGEHTGKMIETSNVSGITYTSSGGLCGASGINGTYKGDSEVERVGGGTVTFDP